ncbi:MAG: PilZ domain-containing protein [Phycisphaeraceae bacterium]
MVTNLATTSEQQASEPTPSYRFSNHQMEKRRSVRQVISGKVTALVKTSVLRRRQRICSLELLNISDTGLGAISQEAVEPGSRISVFFPPHGFERGYDLIGTVVRCHRGDTGHELGIELHAKMAA